LWADDFNGNDPKFVAAALAAFRLERLDAATSVPTLNRNNLTAYEVIVPSSRVEQAKIAAVILEAEALIEALGQLIAKKRDVKQGMMQELLTGRTRLPGFTGGWKLRPIDEVATVVMGQSPSGTSYNTKASGVVLIQGNADIENRRTLDRVWTTSPGKRVRKGDIVLTVRAPVGFTARAHADACLGRGVCGLSTTNSTDFLFHALVAVEDKWALLEQGSTFTSVNSGQVRAFEIDWPMDITEQRAIAGVLNDADAEIVALERRLDSARAVKDGIMQELLTGRTRLPDTEEA
jgi:type I restriction enzyme S subunit